MLLYFFYVLYYIWWTVYAAIAVATAAVYIQKFQQIHIISGYMLFSQTQLGVNNLYGKNDTLGEKYI